MTGRASSSEETLSYFAFPSLTVSGRNFDLEMEMRSSNVRLVLMHGLKRIARMCQFHDYTDLLCQTARL